MTSPSVATVRATTIDPFPSVPFLATPRGPDSSEGLPCPTTTVAENLRHHLFDVDLDVFASVRRAAESILKQARRRSVGTAVFTCNVDHLMLMRKNVDFASAYARAEVRTIDGAPLALLSRITGTRCATRVTGVDLTSDLIGLAEEQGLRVALVGGAEGRAQEAAKRLIAGRPPLLEVFTASPAMGFTIGDDHDERLVEELAEFRPDLVVVCLGAPRQELWIDAHKERFPGCVLVGAGATIDFLSGAAMRAPKLCQRSGTEALWRLSTEFPRLWRRYLVRDIGFLAQFPVVVGSYAASRVGAGPSVRAHPSGFVHRRSAGKARRCGVCVELPDTCAS